MVALPHGPCLFRAVTVASDMVKQGGPPRCPRPSSVGAALSRSQDVTFGVGPFQENQVVGSAVKSACLDFLGDSSDIADP